jgi:hypothetical protein
MHSLVSTGEKNVTLNKYTLDWIIVRLAPTHGSDVFHAYIDRNLPARNGGSLMESEHTCSAPLFQSRDV